MGETLYVDSDNLTGVGNKIKDVAASVRDIYTNFQNCVNTVTSNESWKGAASDSFLEKYERVRPSFEQHLTELEELGPTIVGVANNYSDKENENVGMMKEEV